MPASLHRVQTSKCTLGHTRIAVGKQPKVVQKNWAVIGKSTQDLWLSPVPTHLPCKFYLHTQYGKEASSATSTKGTRHTPNSGSHVLLCPIDKGIPDDICPWD